MVKGNNKAADRLAKLEEQRARINAEIQRVRAREQQQERKNETRRKVLVGAMILAKVNSSEWPEDRLMAAMDAYLERDHDRALFGLPPRQKDEPGFLDGDGPSDPPPFINRGSGNGQAE